MQIYLLHYPKGNRLEYSIGLIKCINEDNYTIKHLCDSSGGSSGGPIINSFNFQVIGIHKGGALKAKNYNLGTLLKEPLEEFNHKTEDNKNTKNNENDKIAYDKENKENEIKRNNEELINEEIANKKLKMDLTQEDNIKKNDSLKTEEKNNDDINNNNIIVGINKIEEKSAKKDTEKKHRKKA